MQDPNPYEAVSNLMFVLYLLCTLPATYHVTSLWFKVYEFLGVVPKANVARQVYH